MAPVKADKRQALDSTPINRWTVVNFDVLMDRGEDGNVTGASVRAYIERSNYTPADGETPSTNKVEDSLVRIVDISARMAETPPRPDITLHDWIKESLYSELQSAGHIPTIKAGIVLA